MPFPPKRSLRPLSIEGMQGGTFLLKVLCANNKGSYENHLETLEPVIDLSLGLRLIYVYEHDTEIVSE